MRVYVGDYGILSAVIGLNLGRLQYREVIEDPEVLSAKLTGLLPLTNYRVYLAAATAQGKGEAIFLDAVTSPPGRKYIPGTGTRRIS